MKAKRQTEVVLNSATMLDGFGGHVKGILLGQATASRPEDYFGFHHSEVEKVHFDKRGVAGIWFRLRCGRVVDEGARPARRDPELYDLAG